MSRYLMNRFISYVDDDGGRVVEFHTDPAGYVERWRARASAARVPPPDGGALTNAEAQAFVDRDYGSLYAMGVHPYLLLHFARALDVVLDGTSWSEFVARYRAQVEPHGFPDFRT
ncbi:MAG: hypothetical protein OEM97_05050 [Acidimicrobiia bacterium]|nr:hypothetical protein [Acidimicrobiia bacterium]